MKKIFILLLLLMTYCLPTYANEQEIVNSFKVFVANLVAPIEATYNKGYYDIVDGTDGYFKTNDYDLTYTYDIKKSDSIMYPYIGILSVRNKTAFSKNYKTEQEARNAFDVQFISENEERYIYKYDNGKWVGKVAYYKLNGQWKVTTDFSLNYFKCTQN